MRRWNVGRRTPTTKLRKNATNRPPQRKLTGEVLQNDKSFEHTNVHFVQIKGRGTQLPEKVAITPTQQNCLNANFAST